MKIFNNTTKEQLHPELQAALKLFRIQRQFNPQFFLDLKAKILNNYLRENKLSAVVVAVSGGIDSAVVLGIVKYAKEVSGSPIQKIIAVTLPVENTLGAVNQSNSKQRAFNLCEQWNIDLTTIELKESFQTLSKKIEAQMNINSQPWAQGQLVSYLRTPVLYYINSLMAESGHPCVIAGTTNKSEGTYLGYVGKASDGMVDLQLISDLYKSEVYQLGNLLGVTEEIINISPTGDMFDGRDDEDIFGASYDFVELYLETLSGNKIDFKTTQAQEQFSKYKKSLDQLHQYNSHKYLVGSPAIHLDLIENKIPPFWGQRQNIDQIDYNKIVNLQELNLKLETKYQTTIRTQKNIIQLKNILNKEEIANIVSELSKKSWISAGKSGYVKDLSKGSERLSNLNKSMSEVLTQRVKQFVPQFIIENNKIYRFSEIAQLFRYIKYPKDGLLYPHRDHIFQYNAKKKTFKSVVIYLTEGSTVFLKETEGGDWSRSSKVNERDLTIKNESGSAIIFDHQLLHESLIHQEEKIIIRTDLVYEEC